VDGQGGKSAVVDETVAGVWPMLTDGRVRPIIGAELPIEQAAEAHRLLASGEVAGKVLLRVSD
jgi:NADPH:quinone reductase-like Zn-dependent oxidoreductase